MSKINKDGRRSCSSNPLESLKWSSVWSALPWPHLLPHSCQEKPGLSGCLTERHLNDNFPRLRYLFYVKKTQRHARTSASYRRGVCCKSSSVHRMGKSSMAALNLHPWGGDSWQKTRGRYNPIVSWDIVENKLPVIVSENKVRESSRHLCLLISTDG